MTTTADYVGRKVDLLAFHGYDSGDPSAPLEQSLAPDGTGGAVVAGVEKLAQRFLVELLTERGSLPYAAARGCSILSEARQGGWRSAGDVTRSFYSSLVDVRRTLLGLESDSDPDDERYASA
mgnify:CR=1 FL=1